jgi:hypothetical protein
MILTGAARKGGRENYAKIFFKKFFEIRQEIRILSAKQVKCMGSVGSRLGRGEFPLGLKRQSANINRLEGLNFIFDTKLYTRSIFNVLDGYKAGAVDYFHPRASVFN